MDVSVFEDGNESFLAEMKIPSILSDNSYGISETFFQTWNGFSTPVKEHKENSPKKQNTSDGESKCDLSDVTFGTWNGESTQPDRESTFISEPIMFKDDNQELNSNTVDLESTFDDGYDFIFMNLDLHDDTKELKWQQQKSPTVLGNLEDFMQIHQIDDDGNCLFRAISYCLYSTDSHHIKLRELSASYMALHRDRFVGFFEIGEVTPTSGFRAIVSALRQPGTWGDHPSIVALSEVLNCNIVVHQQGREHLSFGTESNVAQIHLSYVNNNHYNALVVKAYKENKVHNEEQGKSEQNFCISQKAIDDQNNKDMKDVSSFSDSDDQILLDAYSLFSEQQMGFENKAKQTTQKIQECHQRVKQSTIDSPEDRNVTGKNMLQHISKQSVAPKVTPKKRKVTKLTTLEREMKRLKIDLIKFK